MTIFEQVKVCASNFKNLDVPFKDKKESDDFFTKYWIPIKNECTLDFFVTLVVLDVKHNFAGGTMI